MKLFLFACAIAGVCSQVIFAQTARKAAEENPLATVFYLLSKTDKDSNEEEKVCLANSLAGVEKFSAAGKAIDLVEVDSYVDNEFIALADSLAKKGRIKEASTLTSLLLKRFDGDADELSKLIGVLIKIGRDDEAMKIVRQLENDARIDAYFMIVDAYLESGNRERALIIVDFAFDPAAEMRRDRDKARLGFYYAKLGQEAPALKFAQESLKNVVWTKGIPSYEDSGIIFDVFKTYLLLGKYELIDRMLEKQEKTRDGESLIKIAESYLTRNDPKQAREILERAKSVLDPKVYGDSFDLGNLVDIYVKLNELDKALSIAKSLVGSEYMRQQKLLDIADHYIDKQDRTKAAEILRFALEQADKVGITEAEKGTAWSSGKWEQANYQSAIASRFIRMGLNGEALALISRTKKPYLKASLLAEFVLSGKGKLPLRYLKTHLEEALLLVRNGEEEIFDANKYNVYAKIARTFAEIGMPARAGGVFVEVLSKDEEMNDRGLEKYLLITLCNIGVEFEKSRLRPTPQLKKSLKNIIDKWENDAY
jgi:thioredoxin-like negative regulator of GroEL